MAPPETRRVQGDGAAIQLATWPGGDHRVLCIHGLTANSRCWETIANALNPAATVMAVDLRGRGLSEAPPQGYSITRHVGDLLAVLDDLGLARVTLMGHSLGAFIAAAFSGTHPDRVNGIILVDGGGKLSPEQTAKVFAGIKPSIDRLGEVFDSPESYMQAMRALPFLNPWLPAFEAYFRYEIEDVDGGVRSRVSPKHIEEEIANLAAFDVSAYYPRIAAPVLILRATEGLLADDDILLPADALARMLAEIPDARHIDLQGTNHYSLVFNHNEERDQAIRDFIGTL